jgi:glutaconate CoA-transferase subunit B
VADTDIDAGWRMAWLGAERIAPGETVFVGIGAPCQAAMLARRTGNAGMTMVFESGVIGADPDRMPLSTGSPSVAKGARMVTDMLGVFALLQRGGIDLGILSGAEVGQSQQHGHRSLRRAATEAARFGGRARHSTSRPARDDPHAA